MHTDRYIHTTYKIIYNNIEIFWMHVVWFQEKSVQNNIQTVTTTTILNVAAATLHINTIISTTLCCMHSVVVFVVVIIIFINICWCRQQTEKNLSLACILPLKEMYNKYIQHTFTYTEIYRYVCLCVKRYTNIYTYIIKYKHLWQHTFIHILMIRVRIYCWNPRKIKHQRL